MSRRTSICLWLALALVSADAHAQPDPAIDPRAVALYEEGLAAYKAGAYAAAITAWTESYERSHAPLLLFDLGQAYRLAGDCARAQQHYDRYLYLGAANTPDTRARVESAMAQCTQRAPEAKPAPVAAPLAVIPRPPPRSRDRGRRMRMIGIVTAASGVVLGATGAWFAVRASSAAGDVERGGTWDDATRDLDARARRDDVIGTTLLSVGAAALVGGGVVWYLGRRQQAAVEARITSLPGGAGIAIAGAL